MSFFGQNLRFLRNSHKMSQSAFAEVFGLKRTAVGAYEEERAEPKLELLIKIARHFGVSMEDLLCHSLQNGDGTMQKPAYRGIPYVSANEVTAFAEAVASGGEYQHRQFLQIPGMGEGLIAWEYGRNILIAGVLGEGNLFLDGNRQGRTLLLKRSGISIASGHVGDASAIQSYEIRYIIKCYDKDDHTETMLESISERLDRIDGKLG